MENIILNIPMRPLKLLCLSLALAFSVASYAQSQSAAALAAARTKAQADGGTLGASSLTSGPLTPQAISTTGTTTGASNVWGDKYTGAADSGQTGLSNSSSMIGVGNNAKNKSVAGFKQYDGARDDQANQATYFLNRNPVLKPTISPNDPMINPSNLAVVPDIFASSSTKVCKQTAITTLLDNAEINTCTETFNPYVIPCSNDVSVSFSNTNTCSPVEICIRTPTCNIGQQYSMTLTDNTGMGGDSFNGGDVLTANWICTTDDQPSIVLGTNSKNAGWVSAAVQNNEHVAVNINDGSIIPVGTVIPGLGSGIWASLIPAVDFINTTNCINGQCVGTYVMRIGLVLPIISGQTCTPGLDENGNPISVCVGNVVGSFFQEQSFGAASRITVGGSFSMASLQGMSIIQNNACTVLEGLSQ